MVTVPRRATPAQRREQRRSELVGMLVGPLDELLGRSRSLEEVGLADLLELAGLPRSTFYYAFEGKADLLTAIGLHLVEGLFRPGQRLLEGEVQVPVHAIARAAEEIGEGLNRHPHVSSALLPGLGLARASRELDERIDEVRVRLEQQIAAHDAAGLMRPGIDPGPTAAWLVAMLLHGTGRLLASVGPAARRRNAWAMAEVAWLALYGPSPAPSDEP
jgi:AcrR family transcriptional regulator